MANLLQVTPFLHVPDVDEAVSFFTGLLGFEIQFRATDYAYVHRETVGFRLLKHSPEDEGPLPDRGGVSCYIDVENVDRLVAELSPKLTVLPPEDVRGPVDQVWGQREWMIRMPDRHVLIFGQAIAAST